MASHSVAAFELNVPRVIYGWGSLSRLPAEAARLGARALLVSGKRSLRASGRLEALQDALDTAGLRVTVLDEVEPEPALATVERGLEALGGSGADVLIAVGGGSVLDVGKAIGALAHSPATVAEHHAGLEITTDGLPIIAAPTTAGTGSEVTPNSVLTDPQDLVKASIRGGGLLPRVALVDPELTSSCPQRQTAYAGLDALVQAIEAFTSNGASPATDALAVEAFRHIATYLPAAYRDGADRAAREHVSLGSLLAGIALASARLGLVHGLAHPIGVLHGIPHGLCCALLMPAVLRYNAEAAAAKYAALQESIGLRRGGLEGWFAELLGELRVTETLRDRGLAEADLDRIIPAALASGSTKHNPRAATAEELRELLLSAP